jgi:hypothetical protein
MSRGLTSPGTGQNLRLGDEVIRHQRADARQRWQAGEHTNDRPKGALADWCPSEASSQRIRRHPGELRHLTRGDPSDAEFVTEPSTIEAQTGVAPLTSLRRGGELGGRQ